MVPTDHWGSSSPRSELHYLNELWQPPQPDVATEGSSRGQHTLLKHIHWCKKYGLALCWTPVCLWIHFKDWLSVKGHTVLLLRYTAGKTYPEIGLWSFLPNMSTRQTWWVFVCACLCVCVLKWTIAQMSPTVGLYSLGLKWCPKKYACYHARTLLPAFLTPACQT